MSLLTTGGAGLPLAAAELWWVGAIKAFVVLLVLLLTFAFMTLIERKLLGRFQRRYGPNRAGPFGVLQPFADLIKLVRKAPFQPDRLIHPVLYLGAPVLSATMAFLAFSVIPWGGGWELFGYQIDGQVVNVPISLVVIFAIGSISTYGVCSAVGSRSRNTRSSAPCARALSSSPTKWRWRCRCSAWC